MSGINKVELYCTAFAAALKGSLEGGLTDPVITSIEGGEPVERPQPIHFGREIQLKPEEPTPENYFENLLLGTLDSDRCRTLIDKDKPETYCKELLGIARRVQVDLPISSLRELTRLISLYDDHVTVCHGDSLDRMRVEIFLHHYAHSLWHTRKIDGKRLIVIPNTEIVDSEYHGANRLLKLHQVLKQFSIEEGAESVADRAKELSEKIKHFKHVSTEELAAFLESIKQPLEEIIS